MTMTGSNLAGHRLLEVLVAPCSAPRSSHGGVALRHPSNDPHRPALRASSRLLGERAVRGDMPGTPEAKKAATSGGKTPRYQIE